MFVQSLYLKNFRNFDQAHLHFSPRINLIYGANAQGKTNLVEALYFLSTGRSFRTNHVHELIRQGETQFCLEAHFIKDSVEQRLSVTFNSQVRKILYNHTYYPTFTSLLGILPTVLYVPSDSSLISGGPSERRRFLDLHLAQIDPLYMHHLMRYHKALKQRNCLLRQKSENTLDPWEYIMAHSGCYLMQRRKETLERFISPLEQSMSVFSENREKIDLSYENSLKPPLDPALLLNQIRKNRHKDIQFGSCLIGPHKDDYQIFINGKKSKLFASEGQKRCAIAALRMAEWDHLERSLQTKPLMIIDDFSTSLDAERTIRLKNRMGQLGQVFLTTPSFLSIDKNDKSFLIENEKIIQSHV